MSIDLDLVPMALALYHEGPLTAFASVVNDMRKMAEEHADEGIPTTAAVVLPEVFTAEVIQEGDGPRYTGHWRDAAGRLHGEDYLAARAIHAARPSLTSGEIVADAVALVRAGRRQQADVNEDAHSLIFYRDR